jgi:sulfur carrier protein ThiS
MPALMIEPTNSTQVPLASGNATATATATIEIHAFMWLSDLFKVRHWTNPRRLEVDEAEMTGRGLLIQLAIPTDRVAVMFLNHRVVDPAEAIIHPGDRVALVPPGAPLPF